LIDYPEKVCSVIFISGCNFRCGYCHNKDLVLDNPNNPLRTIPESEILRHLDKRKHLIDAVCITGGEPTLYIELIELIKKIKKLNLLVKLDTNGSNPKLLKELINNNLINYIAMDVKALLEKEKYEKTINTNIDIETIKKTIDIITKSGIGHEFRTTVVPSLLSKEDMIDIAKQLATKTESTTKSTKTKLVLQQFTKQTELLDSYFNNQQSYSDEELEEIRKECEEFVKTEIR